MSILEDEGFKVCISRERLAACRDFSAADDAKISLGIIFTLLPLSARKPFILVMSVSKDSVGKIYDLLAGTAGASFRARKNVTRGEVGFANFKQATIKDTNIAAAHAANDVWKHVCDSLLKVRCFPHVESF